MEEHHEQRHDQAYERPYRSEPREHAIHQYQEAKRGSSGDKTSRYLLWGTGIQILLLLFIAFQIRGLGGIPVGAAVADAPEAAPSPSAQAPSVDMVALVDDDPVKGDQDAPVTIIEWSDFECPFCGRFYSQTADQIESQYIDTGKVKFVYRDFPLSFHPNAQKAAEAGECADEQGKFWEMHDLLFEQGVQGGVASFKQFAQQLGLDTAGFNNCLDSGAMASEVQRDIRDGTRAGIQGTPGFLVNGQLVSGAQPFSVFQQIIDAELN